MNLLTTPGERFRRSAFTSKPLMFKRVRFFSGQILSAQDFQVEQQYQLEKRRLLNRYLHGSGIVAGLHVTLESDTVIVSPGFALDPLGNEIVIDRPMSVDTKPCANDVCYLFLRYTESGTDPVPAGNDRTEFSRMTESFLLTVQDGGAAPPDAVCLGRLLRQGNCWIVDGATGRDDIVKRKPGGIGELT
jgi:hypothetical protein